MRTLAATFALALFALVLVPTVGGDLAAAPALKPADARVTRIVVEKAARTLTLFRGDTVVASYRVALGDDPVGAKEREGDSRTPEGRYRVDFKNTASRYHLSLKISYPDAGDRARAAAAGVSPGGDIMIHGLPSGYGWLGASHRAHDWTDGCVAVTNTEIEEIWSLVDVGTPIEITP
jgi:murein L,D-transpeptidase YafK